MPEIASINFHDDFSNQVGVLYLYPQTGSDAEILIISEEEAKDSGESQVQLLEGGRYEYELLLLKRYDTPKIVNLNIEFGESKRILAPSKLPASLHKGILSTGLNTGRLSLCLQLDGIIVARSAIEIRSRKLTYKEDYRKMLENITDHGIELLMDLRSPSRFKVVSDPGKSPQTISQRFAFLQGLIGSKSFQDALHRIISHPHQSWGAKDSILNIRRGFRPDGKTIRRLAKSPRRTPLAQDHPLAIAGIKSIAERVDVLQKVQTYDTLENRFVKFTLETFIAFLIKMCFGLKDEKDVRLVRQISSLIGKLQNFLSNKLFRAVSNLDILPYGSPVLQRKEGYREIFQSWLRFGMAARLVWRGGDDVYGAGQRDVAALYEYWVFFQLLKIVCNAFGLKRPSADQLIEETADGFGLKLKSGNQMDFVWVALNGSRRLRVRYSYNRRFSHKKAGALEGSWTARMRPDYTLSIWPDDFTSEQAEAQELMSHIHFDAKYRIDTVQQLFGVSDEELPQAEQAIDGDLETEKREQNEGRYKRADLLKMHAYKDSIRRTHGAYIIYPGTESRRWEGFHEILPGIGAFPLRPDAGQEELEIFLKKIATHASYRASARERHSYHTYEVYRKTEPEAIYLENLINCIWPEHDGIARTKPPSDINVLIDYCNGATHLAWVKEEKIYNTGLCSGADSSRLSPEVSGAKYLLLVEEGSRTCELFSIKGNGPRIFTKDELSKRGCPCMLSRSFFLVFEIGVAEGFERLQWNCTTIQSQQFGQHADWCHTTSLDKLLDIAEIKQ